MNTYKTFVIRKNTGSRFWCHDIESDSRSLSAIAEEAAQQLDVQAGDVLAILDLTDESLWIEEIASVTQAAKKVVFR